MKVSERIAQLRKLMEQQGIDYYVVPTADYHQSEYVGEHFKVRKWITGFGGSAGTAIIALKNAGLWTDGRYFIAAAEQLKGSGVDLFKMGEPEVPTIPEFLNQSLTKGQTIGFDGRTVSMGDGLSYEAIAKNHEGFIKYDQDLIDKLWSDRPSLSTKPAFFLETKYSGEDTASKLSRLREKMSFNNSNTHVLTSLDDICWLLNIRGDDIDFFPMVLSYAVVTMNEVELFIDESKLNDEIHAEFTKNRVNVHAYNDIYEFVKGFDSTISLLADPVRMNYALIKNVADTVQITETANPTVLFKAVKNETEIKNMKQAQIKDGVAHTKYMYWLKHNVGNIKITELSATKKLEDLRKEQEGYIRQSFAPITAFGEHGAIVHYEATEETDVELSKGTFLLSDTGAGFYEGSTDITRTFALGEVSDELKKHYTITLRSNIQMDMAKFLHGVNGTNLDILARQPFWREGLNYNHGTGHGVGYLLNIHEGPIGLRWQYRPGESHPFEAGMVVTNEPGVYIQGSHGVRLENELLVVEAEKNEYGQFMQFETMSYVPFDVDAMTIDMLLEEEKTWLNNYHALVRNLIGSHLTKEENTWLEEITKDI
ncbi:MULTISPECIES: aminopeptidase P family protein [Vagococcus]|uniref:Xaa-Pro aminopeptidase n=1 Tax=Vagococcus fluvialis bH819 TaxID=1255619 RepID=A0A1X6WK02_9ENTE|nr:MULTISPECIES: aminopeptidase P family protein [Vagococcus]SLM84567.1 Xaa-Pro aminopeptidase [Vagococcus fluvialis bH819]HCM89968.1 aminopeptidase P family protein [Vagococcus sp.]